MGWEGSVTLRAIAVPPAYPIPAESSPILNSNGRIGAFLLCATGFCDRETSFFFFHVFLPQCYLLNRWPPWPRLTPPPFLRNRLPGAFYDMIFWTPSLTLPLPCFISNAVSHCFLAWPPILRSAAYKTLTNLPFSTTPRMRNGDLRVKEKAPFFFASKVPWIFFLVAIYVQLFFFFFVFSFSATHEKYPGSYLLPPVL